ncbi:MAG TPA: extracellular solute-binding protein [Gaiellaceae bacterium]|nr:extracellular solute-binding protein [Gaiellaceae bacterium]
MRRRSLVLLLAPLALVVFLAVFLGPRLLEEESPGQEELDRLAEEAVDPGRVEVWGAWEGAEQEAFEAVLAGYMEAFPGTDVVYVPLGDELEGRIRAGAAEGALPDLAILSGTRLAQELAEEGLLLPLHRIEQEAEEPFGESFVAVGGYGDQEPYGVMVKPRNESLLWYSAAAYEGAGLEPPADWEELVEGARGLTASGVPAYAVPGAEGAALMDVFEALFLQTGGTDFYDFLLGRNVPWTHETVVAALEELARVVGDEESVAGGVEGALSTDLQAAAAQVAGDPPEAAQLLGGEEAGAGTAGLFPPLGGAGPVAIVTGDQVVMFRYSRVSEDLMSYLVTDEAIETFTSFGLPTLARDVDPAIYTDPTTRVAVTGLRDAEAYRYDLSDLLPEELASIEGTGLLPLFQELVGNPDDAREIAERMEAVAKQVYQD